MIKQDVAKDVYNIEKPILLENNKKKNLKTTKIKMLVSNSNENRALGNKRYTEIVEK